MTTEHDEAIGWLRELCGRPADARSDWLRARPDADLVLTKLLEACESLTLSNAPGGVEATAALLPLVDARGTPGQRVLLRRVRAQSLAYTGKLPESLAACGEAIALAESEGEALEGARARMVSIHPLAEMARYDDALAAGVAAREVFVEMGEGRLAAFADVNLGGIHRHRDDPASALLHYDRARTALGDDPVRLGWLASNRGEALLLLHDFEAAEASFRESLESSNRAGAALAAAIAQGNLGDLAARRGDLQGAVYHFEHARARLERSEAHSHLTRLIAEQAEAYHALGLHEQALRAFDECIPRLQALGLVSESARATASRGATLAKLGMSVVAAAELAEAAAQFRRLGLPHAAARADLLRVELAAEHGQTTQARELLDAIRDELLRRPADRALLHLLEARIALHEARDAEAGAAIESALQLSRDLSMAGLTASALGLRATLHERQSRFGEQLADLREAVSLIESARGALRAARFRTSFLGSRRQLYEQLARALLAQGALDEAFGAIERAKSRALLEAMCGEEIRETDPDAETQRGRRELTRLRSHLSALLSQLEDPGERNGDGRGGEALNSRIAECERSMDDLEARLAARRGGRASLSEPPSLDAVRASLPHGAIAVEYFAIGSDLCAMLIAGDAPCRWMRLASLDAVSQLVRKVHFQLGRAARPGVRESAQVDSLERAARRELLALHDAVWRPLASAVEPYARVRVVPHAGLHRAPFHALWDGQHYLTERREITYSPSAGVLHFLATRAPEPQRGGTLIVGVPDESAHLIARECDEVAAIAGAALRLDGAAATADALLDAAPGAELIHLACHGRFSASHPLTSGLKLADRWLTLRELRDLQLRARLITLSGCETGRAGVAGADELQGFLRAFLAAGADALVVSLWPVDDVATRGFMQRFYADWYPRRHTSGAAADAIRAAQIDLLQRWRHPTFWAPFILVGEA